MAKQPSFQFYPGDWLKDPRLSICSPSTRGVWVDILCAMHELDHCGSLTGTPEQLARICRCTVLEFTHAIAELASTFAADVTQRHENVTVVNRRMLREYNTRQQGRLRKQRQRGHAGVTKKSRLLSSSSSSPSGGKSPPCDKNGTEEKTKPKDLSILDLKDRKEALSEILSGIRVKHNFSYAEERREHPEAYAEYKSVRAKITEINRQIAGLE